MAEHNFHTEDTTYSSIGNAWKSRTDRAFEALMKIANASYINVVCNASTLLACLLFASFLSNFAIGEIVHELRSGKDNSLASNRSDHLARRLFNSKNHTTYYNASIGDGEKKAGPSGGRMCLKERGRREIGKKRKERSNDRTRTMPKMKEADDDSRGRNPGCNSCMREEMRTISLEAIKGNILSKLGMSQPPNLKGKKFPKLGQEQLAALLSRRHANDGGDDAVWIQQDGSDGKSGSNLYRNFRNESRIFRSRGNASKTESYAAADEVSDEEDDDYHVRTEKIVTISQQRKLALNDPRIGHSPHAQLFEFSDNVRNSRLKRAVLWVYIRGRNSAQVVGDKITISVYKVGRTRPSGQNVSQEPFFITSVLSGLGQYIPKGQGAWITLDYGETRKLVAEWLTYPQRNLGLVVTAEDANGTNLAVTSAADHSTSYVPFLELYVADSKKQRQRRSVGLSCNESSNETRCCKYPLTVNFEEFGWDWIIAPKRYRANSCLGECPFTFLTQHPHTHLMQLANIPGIGACCSPRKLSDIYMVYFDLNMNIVHGMVPGMVVDRCGCD